MHIILHPGMILRMCEVVSDTSQQEDGVVEVVYLFDKLVNIKRKLFY